MVDAELVGMALPHLFGNETYARACIAAQLGEKDRAVALLQRTFGQGFFFQTSVHRDLELEPLRGYPPFEELIRPKD
jgi:hypothetical protein